MSDIGILENMLSTIYNLLQTRFTVLCPKDIFHSFWNVARSEDWT